MSKNQPNNLFLTHEEFAHPAIRYGFGRRITSDEETPPLPKLKQMYSHEILKFPGISSVMYVKQVHSSKVVHIQEPNPEIHTMQADALITTEPNIALAVITADCLPVLIVAEEPLAVAAVHAGWRGIAGGIIENTLQEFSRRWATEPKFMYALLGPAISADVYEVSEELARMFEDSFGKDSVSTTKWGTPSISLENAAARILMNHGIPKSNIYKMALCTYTEESDFYSYRRQKEAAGRQFSFVAITNREGNKPGEIEL